MSLLAIIFVHLRIMTYIKEKTIFGDSLDRLNHERLQFPLGVQARPFCWG